MLIIAQTAETTILCEPASAGVRRRLNRSDDPLGVTYANGSSQVAVRPAKKDPSDILTLMLQSAVLAASVPVSNSELGVRVIDTGVGATAELTVSENMALADAPFLVAVTTILCTPSSEARRRRLNRRAVPLVVTNAIKSLDVAKIPEGEEPSAILMAMPHSMVLPAALSSRDLEFGVSVTDAGVGAGAITYYPSSSNDATKSQTHRGWAAGASSPDGKSSSIGLRLEVFADA